MNSTRKKVAVVVQRCHESVVGGSETLAWQYANLLKNEYEVDVLSTTATDAAYWTNVLPEGLEVRDGINIRRFHVDVGYSPFRTELFTRMIEDFTRFEVSSYAPNCRRHIPWTIGLQNELVRRIGPWLPEHRTGRANLQAAFPDWPSTEIERVLDGVWDNLGRIGAEFVHLDRLWHVIDVTTGEMDQIEGPFVAEASDRVQGRGFDRTR